MEPETGFRFHGASCVCVCCVCVCVLVRVFLPASVSLRKAFSSSNSCRHAAVFGLACLIGFGAEVSHTVLLAIFPAIFESERASWTHLSMP